MMHLAQVSSQPSCPLQSQSSTVSTVVGRHHKTATYQHEQRRHHAGSDHGRQAAGTIHISRTSAFKQKRPTPKLPATLACLVILLTMSLCVCAQNDLTEVETSRKVLAGGEEPMVSIKPSPELLAKLALHKAKAASAIDHSQIQGSNYTIYWDHTYPGHALLNGYPSIFSTVPESHRVTLIVTGYECRTVKTLEAAKAFLAAIPGVETVIIPESAKEDLHMGILCNRTPQSCTCTA